MRKSDDDDVALPPSDDETCVSGLIGNVITLIVSILLWLQKVGCKNTSGADGCPGVYDLRSTLDKLTLFAKQADEFGVNTSENKPCVCPKTGRRERKDKNDNKNDKSLKRDKSGENQAVLYAVTQDEGWDLECKKCCRKGVEPKEKKESDNVVFEVVAAQMTEAQTQTDLKNFVDNYTQPDESYSSHKETEVTASYISSYAQVSGVNILDKALLSAVETADKEVQVEIEVMQDVQDEECECTILQDKDTNVRFKEGEQDVHTVRTVYSSSADEEEDGYEEEEDAEEGEEEEDEEDYNDMGPDGYLPCPTRCIPYAQTRQMPVSYRRQAQYSRGQSPVRQEQPMYYQAYESPPSYKQYGPAYVGQDAYPPMRYPYQPQSYYHKVTRTVQRMPPSATRKPDYPPQRQMSPTQRGKLVQDGGSDFKGEEKFSQPEAKTPPTTPASLSPRTSKNEREQIGPSKEQCVPHCPGNKPTPVRKLSATPVPTPQMQPPPPPTPKPQSAVMVRKECDPKCAKYNKPIVTEKPEVTKTPSRKCVSRCATSANSNKSKTNSADPKQKSRPVALMPKGAIPVEPRDVLEVEEAPPSKQQIVADSVIAVEASKQKQ